MSQYVRRPSSRSKARWLLWLLGSAALLLLALTVLRVGAAPEVSIEPGLDGIGPRTPVVVRAEAPGRGLSGLRVELEQDGEVTQLAEREHQPRPFWAFWGDRVESDEIEVEVGRESIASLREGTATLRVVAERASTPLRRPDPTILERSMPVRLVPPTLVAQRGPYRASVGGAGVVVYRAGESAVADGVSVGELRFPGYDLPGEDGGRFAFYGVPDDFEGEANDVMLFAEDDLGNRATQTFLGQLVPTRFTSDDIEVGDGFLERVVPAIAAQTPSIDVGDSLVDTYVQINSELRRANTATLVELAAKSRPELLWSGPFRQLPNSVVTGRYGDRRTYYYGEEEIDRATHLGYDLASVREATVPAANRGVVVLAEFLGIYGNVVVLDHGYGIHSLYSHLSQIDVAVGDEVEAGANLGRTGSTGLAGGDHLHFTMMVGPVQVSPIEWFDQGWIRDRLASHLGDGLPLLGDPAG